MSPHSHPARRHAATITLNHDSKRNALCKALIEALIKALDDMSTAGVRSVILRAKPGAAVWSAGHDVSELPRTAAIPSPMTIPCAGWCEPSR